MLNVHLRYTLLLLGFYAFPALLYAGWFGGDFSADAVHFAAGNKVANGRMYVGNGRVRTELNRNGVSIVEIINPDSAKAILLFPAKKQYMERQLPNIEKASGNTGNPCNELEDMQCRKIGVEDVNGRKADKWEILNKAGERAYQWSDAVHHFAVKREFSGSVMMELVYQGNEQVNGRMSEKWRSIVLGSDGNVVESYQWYDPELNIAIRQTMVDGSTRELKNIVIAPQPDELFGIPADYQKVLAGQLPGN